MDTTGPSETADTGSSETAPNALEGPERLVGQRILDFELKSVLGSGGMSVVYRGQHRLTGQEVAIKILPPELAVHDDLKARFVEEARVLALLDHPNIVGLNNLTEQGGRFCIVMTYVPGVTFEHLIHTNGRVEPAEVKRIGLEVLRALEYAHQRNVIHRDIKPSNVLIRPDGVIKVTDFGIAKILGQTRLTSTGQTMGTVRYMSPEQVRGRALDPRSDLYSLGITLYEALAGRTPFDSENQFEIMQQQINKSLPPFATFGVAVPPALERVLRRSMQKNPNDRFADAAAFIAALEGVVVEAGPAPSVPVTTPRSWPSWLLPVAVALGSAVVVGGGAAWWRLHARVVDVRPVPVVKPLHKTAQWPEPYALPGVAMGTDQTFASDGIRVQSVVPRDATAMRDAYRRIVPRLRAFLAAQSPPAVRAVAAKMAPLPLNVELVPQALLNRPDLWPGVTVSADRTYPSRYVEPRRTLFLADTAAYLGADLAYGAALHVLYPVTELTTDDCVDLAERFAGTFGLKH